MWYETSIISLKLQKIKMSKNLSFSSETSERYSRALYEVAIETKELDKVESDIKNYQLVYNNSLELKNFFKNPTLNINDQNKVVNLLSQKLGFSKNLNNFFLLLIKKRRIFFIEKIIDSFLKICSKGRNEIKASLISSKELSLKEIDDIAKDLSTHIGLRIKFDYKVDEELIGGLKLQLGSLMVDTSLKNKLKKYERKMLEK